MGCDDGCQGCPARGGCPDEVGEDGAAPCVARLNLPYPPSGNDRWNAVGGRYVESREAREYKRRVAALVPVFPLAGPVTLSGVIYRPRAAGDLDNRLKTLLDALEGRTLLNDGQVTRYRDLSLKVDAANPRAELLLEGQRWATPEEVQAWVLARAAKEERRRQGRRGRKALQVEGSTSQRAAPKARPAYVAHPKGDQP